MKEVRVSLIVSSTSLSLSSGAGQQRVLIVSSG